MTRQMKRKAIRDLAKEIEKQKKNGPPPAAAGRRPSLVRLKAFLESLKK